jgi:hypothetical protein
MYAEDKASNQFFEASEVSDIEEYDSDYDHNVPDKSDSSKHFPDTEKKGVHIETNKPLLVDIYSTTELVDQPSTEHELNLNINKGAESARQMDLVFVSSKLEFS